MYKLIISASLLAVGLAGSAQQFQTVSSSGQVDLFHATEKTTDGGYLMGGMTNGGNLGGNDGLLVKSDPFGEIEWSKILGSGASDNISAFAIGPTGNILVGGSTGSTSQNGVADIFYGSISPAGDLEWVQYISLPGQEGLHQILIRPSGELLLLGTSRSYSSNFDVFITACDPNGNLLWSKAYGTEEYEAFRKGALDDEGNLFLWGHRTGEGAQEYDAFLMKINNQGELLWSKNMGAAANELAWDITLTASGDVLVTGDTNSAGAGLNDTYLARFSPDGELLWAKLYGNFGHEHGISITHSQNDMYIISGATSSLGAGGLDFMALFVNELGDLKYATAFGGPIKDVAHAAVAGGDGGVFLAGETRSFGTGMYSGLGVKINQDGSCACNNAYAGDFQVMPFEVLVTDAGFTPIGAGAEAFAAEDMVLVDLEASHELMCSDQISQEGMSRPIAEINDVGKEIYSKIKLYPNPANGPVKALLQGHPELPSMLRVFDLKGSLVFETVLPAGRMQEELTIDGLSTGIYLVRSQTGSEIETKRLVIQ